MFGTLLTLLACTLLLLLSQSWWRSYANPISLGILAWTPALVMLNWPPYFLSPIYIHLNRPVSANIYIAMAMGLVSFWAGCAMVKTLSPPHSFEPRRSYPNDVNSSVAIALFVIGFLVFLYSFYYSGLADIANLDDREVAESQLNLHLGALSFVMIFMDMAAIAMFTLFIRTGRIIYTIIPVISILCYAATLQKSPVVWLAISYGVVALVHPRASYRLLLGTLPRRFLIGGLFMSMIVGFFVMNQARGVGADQMTGASGPLMEQIYIYSGASAIMNLSVTIDGYLPSDPMLYGAYLTRNILWHVVDRDLFGATRYFGGVNTGTYLLYGWADFRWFGFVIAPFLTGTAVMIFIRFALTGRFLGIVFGAVAIRAVALSTATDVIFDPVTPILLVIAACSAAAMQFLQRAAPQTMAPAASRRVRPLSASLRRDAAAESPAPHTSS